MTKNSNLYLLVLYTALLNATAAASVNLPNTLLGWCGTGGDLSGVSQQITNVWTGRSSWSDLENIGWPSSSAGYMAYFKSNPNGAVDFATALIPHGLPSTQWNGLLDEVVAGEHDDVFVQEGNNMAKWGTNIVYCRPWWEMTMSVTNLDATKFKAAWNHAIPIIRSAFAAAAPTKTLKIAYCYLPDAQGDPKTYFPGIQNVDVIDADIYGKVWGTTTPSQTAMLAMVQKDLTYLATFAATENKGAGVSEWANVAVLTQGKLTNQGRGDDPEYITTMLNFGTQNHFLYMVYFNETSGGPGQTLANTPLSLAAFRAALATAQAPAATTTSNSDLTPPATTGSTTTTSTPPASTPTTSTNTVQPATSTPTSPTLVQPAPTTTTSSTQPPVITTGSSSPVQTADTSTQATTTFAGWQAKYFSQAQLADSTVSGPNADPYGSGIPNLLAYAFQLDPAAAQRSNLPQPTVNNGHLTMSYQVPSAITDINFVPEVSSDLETWNSGSSAVQVVSNIVGTNGTTIAVEDCLPTNTRAHYMRLRVTQSQ